MEPVPLQETPTVAAEPSPSPAPTPVLKPTPVDRWQQYLCRLLPEARASIERESHPIRNWTALPESSELRPPRDSEELFAFQQYLGRLPRDTAAHVRSLQADAPTASLRPARLSDYAAGFGHFAVVAPDGEWSELRRYRDKFALAADAAGLIAQDVQFFGGYGVIYPISKGPSRVMLTHDGDAVQLSPAVAMVADLLDTELQLQDNFFLGDDSLSPEIVRRPRAADLAVVSVSGKDGVYAEDEGEADDGDDDFIAAANTT